MTTKTTTTTTTTTTVMQPAVRGLALLAAGKDRRDLRGHQRVSRCARTELFCTCTLRSP